MLTVELNEIKEKVKEDIGREHDLNEPQIRDNENAIVLEVLDDIPIDYMSDDNVDNVDFNLERRNDVRYDDVDGIQNERHLSEVSVGNCHSQEYFCSSVDFDTKELDELKKEIISRIDKLENILIEDRER